MACSISSAGLVSPGWMRQPLAATWATCMEGEDLYNPIRGSSIVLAVVVQQALVFAAPIDHKLGLPALSRLQDMRNTG